MRAHVTDNKELREQISKAIQDNNGYCPCVLNSQGKEEYKCVCRDFIDNVKPGESCHCGLYIKDE